MIFSFRVQSGLSEEWQSTAQRIADAAKRVQYETLHTAAMGVATLCETVFDTLLQGDFRMNLSSERQTVTVLSMKDEVLAEIKVVHEQETVNKQFRRLESHEELCNGCFLSENGGKDFQVCPARWFGYKVSAVGNQHTSFYTLRELEQI